MVTAAKKTFGVSEQTVGGWLEPYLAHINDLGIVDSEGYPANSTVFYSSLKSWLNTTHTVQYALDIVYEKDQEKLRTVQINGYHKVCMQCRFVHLFRCSKRAVMAHAA